MSDTRVSIIVLTFNRIKYFKNFVRCLYRSTKTPFQLIVVDNGSVDGTRDYILELEKEGKVYKHVFTNSNLLMSRAFSEGFELVDTEFVITVADDMFVTPELKHDWLDLFIKKMDSDEQIGCVNFLANRCRYESFIRTYGE